ncbi:MAG: aldehyde dehydrogenase [Oligoflexales bacterium]
MQKIDNYINGELVPPKKVDYLDNFNPATGEIYSQVANSSSLDLEDAIVAASEAYPAWSGSSNDERSALIRELADEVGRRSEALAMAEVQDTGKPLSLAMSVDIPRAASNLRFFANAITQFSSQSHSMGGLGLNYTLRDSLGLVACISPWNLPLYLFTWKIAPALAAGNCVIAKPSEITPMTAYLFSQICSKVGLPAGVLSILHGAGSEIGAKICAHDAVKAISFTGGTQTGATIASMVAPKFKKVSLELGGKNPCLVFADSNLEDVANQVVKAAFTNQGQICLCASRIYVEKKIYEEFSELLTSKTRNLKVGDPLEENTNMGALISASHLQKVQAYVDKAVEEGAKILVGGSSFRPSGRCIQGSFFEPTILSGVSQNSCVNQEEIFGPVITLQPFADEKEALQLANDSKYGLSASIWSQDLSRCHRLAKNIEAGIVWVNSWMLRDLRTPFGGYKSSGLGREGGLDALNFFTQSKNVCIKY